MSCVNLLLLLPTAMLLIALLQLAQLEHAHQASHCRAQINVPLQLGHDTCDVIMSPARSLH